MSEFDILQTALDTEEESSSAAQCVEMYDLITGLEPAKNFIILGRQKTLAGSQKYMRNI